jgi:ABC-type uncharacterized transport system substrate-binding protein
MIQSLRILKVLPSIAAASIFAACAPVPYVAEAPDPAPITAPPPEPVAEAIPEAPPPAPPAPPAPIVPTRTAVLLSDDIPAFTDIAREIELRTDSDQLTVYNLDGNPLNIARIRTEAAEVDQVIAIGLLAATVGREIPSKRMVFCQVFNYQDYDLLSATSKGVNLLPPFDLQLQRWKALAPDLNSVGIIVGSNQDDLIAEIRAAAAHHGIELAVREVSSDKEALFAFERLTPDIQGIWLLPDNRILSPEVVREIMSYSARHRKQVLVFGSNLLGVGGLMSVTSDPGDVAEQVLARLDQISADGTLSGPAMRPLTTLEIEINPDVAKHLGVDISQTNLSAANSDR